MKSLTQSSDITEEKFWEQIPWVEGKSFNVKKILLNVSNNGKKFLSAVM